MSQKFTAQAATFLSHAESALAWFQWIAVSRQSDDILRGRVVWDGLSASQNKLIRDKFDLAAPEQRLILNALYVTVAAAFEEYLRQLVGLLSDEFVKGSASWRGDVDAVLMLNVRESAKLLRRIDSPPDYLSIDFWEVCRNLGTCHPGSEKIALNSIALADVDGLLKLENFMERGKVFGTALSFDFLGKNDDICALLGLKKSNPRENGKLIRAAIYEISRLRNRIAHTGVNASDVTESVLHRDIPLLKVLAKVIDIEVSVAIAGMPKRFKK